MNQTLSSKIVQTPSKGGSSLLKDQKEKIGETPSNSDFDFVNESKKKKGEKSNECRSCVNLQKYQQEDEQKEGIGNPNI